jgi:hypothetical protein
MKDPAQWSLCIYVFHMTYKKNTVIMHWLNFVTDTGCVGYEAGKVFLYANSRT